MSYLAILLGRGNWQGDDFGRGRGSGMGSAGSRDSIGKLDAKPWGGKWIVESGSVSDF